MSILGFIDRYFITPTYTGEGYNIYNTIVYAILLGIGVVLSYKILERLKIRVDEKLLIAFLPFMVLASILRALEDACILPKTAWFLTPGIFFLIFFLVMPLLVVSHRLTENYHLIMIFLGMIFLTIPSISVIRNIVTIRPAIYTMALFFVLCYAFMLAVKYLKIDIFGDIKVYGIFAAHFLDVSATVVGIRFFDYWEEHYFENIIISHAGTSLILIPLKIAVISIAIILIQKIMEDENERNFWYLALFILGFPPGLRDMLKMTLIG